MGRIEINAQTATTLGLTVPPTLPGANEAIEQLITTVQAVCCAARHGSRNVAPPLDRTSPR
jgi:hypothetical protein